MLTKKYPELLPILSCLLASILWGVLWYPLRVLEQMGISGLWATLIIFLSALVPISFSLWQQRRALAQQPVILIMIGLFTGWTNLAFILALLEGTVVRVLLLFYLSPIWTVLLGWLVLKERLSVMAWGTVLIALAGAIIMLWHPDTGLLLPRDKADLLAISAGFAFAVTNVLIRKSGDIPIVVKMGPACLGGVLLALVGLLFTESPMPTLSIMPLLIAICVGCFGMVIMTYSAQYGVTHLPLHRSAVIFLFEVVAGAISAALLTSEVVTLQEWSGGALVMLAAWLTAMDSMWNNK